MTYTTIVTLRTALAFLTQEEIFTTDLWHVSLYRKHVVCCIFTVKNNLLSANIYLGTTSKKLFTGFALLLNIYEGHIYWEGQNSLVNTTTAKPF